MTKYCTNNLSIWSHWTLEENSDVLLASGTLVLQPLNIPAYFDLHGL